MWFLELAQILHTLLAYLPFAQYVGTAQYMG
jgi:hypothetical protein